MAGLWSLRAKPLKPDSGTSPRTVLSPRTKMLRTLAIGVLVLPSVVFASNEEISRNRNATTTNTTTLASADSDRQANNSVRIADGLPGPWVADLFYQALANFTIQEDVGTSACQKQTQQYIGGLKNNSYWAVKSKCSMLSTIIFNLRDTTSTSNNWNEEAGFFFF